MQRLARWFVSRPGAQLVAGAVVIALAFPATSSGSIARLVLFGALGVAIAAWWPRLPHEVRRPPAAFATAIVMGILLIAGLSVFWDAMTTTPDWQLGDWGPQHAVLARLVPALKAGHGVPVWNHAVGTGDAPLELYPAATYLVAGELARVLGLAGDLPRAFMILATLVHLALALTTTAVAIRVASRPIAFALGLLWLVDGGAISHGGTIGLFHWAILHSAFAHVFSMIAALGILAALVRPRLGASLAIWLGTAIATASHPAALITAAACALGLVAVALLASDVPPRRALVALGHLAIGVALGAIVWIPAAERLLLYGQHFPNELMTPLALLQLIAATPMPMTSYALVVYTGYLGIATGMFVRRAEVVFVAVVALVMIVGLCDAPYLALGLTPGLTVARLGAIRMMLLARPFVFAACAYAISTLIGRARAPWAAAPRRARYVAAAVLGVCVLSLVRLVPAYWDAEAERALAETNQIAPDPEGRAVLEDWAREQMASLPPGTMARALFEQTTHEQLHLTATTGLPVLHMGALPDLLLRERIEDTSPASLARFDIRWVIGVDQSPALGDPDSEVVVGSYHIRTVTAWDGQFARIERGHGTVKVVRLDDRAVEIDVTAREPVLVALGTGYYPRWRARHASGAAEPVYALPSFPGASLHVVSAWVAPGRTVFTCDGPLPSDGDGRILAILAALLALAIVIVWSRPRWRFAVLRRVARARRRLPAVTGWAVELGVSAIVIALTIRGCVAQVGRTPALLVGSGLRSTATVEARLGDGAWERCGYSAVRGVYRCEDRVTVSDETANLVNDAPPSWPFITPAIMAAPEHAGVEVRITRVARLAGTYRAAASTGTVTLAIGDNPGKVIGAAETIDVHDRGAQQVTVTAKLPDHSPLTIAMVAEDTLEPRRPFLAPPPASAPASVQAIR